MPDAYEQQMSPVAPHLVVSNASAAIEFYQRAFGAQELVRHAGPDGKIWHASLMINGGMVMLCDDFPEYCGGVSRAPDPQGQTPVTIHLQVQDADAAYNQAAAAGATVAMPLADMFWGDRYGKLRDPFGHEWSIGAAVKKVTEAEVNEAMQAFAAKGQ